MEITKKLENRDNYVDFLRSMGLILLIGVHVFAPHWYVEFRCFDVPLMVFISSLCYHPSDNGYLSYCIKRFKRIYIPVVIFLIIFICLQQLSYELLGKPVIGIKNYIGSFLLLNNPSIGYVWIMRVFLMMAIIMPLLYLFVKRLNFFVTNVVVMLLIILQTVCIQCVENISNTIIRFILDQTLLYLIGYMSICVIGLKIRDFSYKWIVVLTMFWGLVLFGFVLYDNGFQAQIYKYPPQSLYLIYGIFASVALICVKPYISCYANLNFFMYLSKNSMWIYLWHIIPVYVLYPFSKVPNIWFAKYLFVLMVAILLNMFFHRIIKIFPERIQKLIG